MLSKEEVYTILMEIGVPRGQIGFRRSRRDGHLTHVEYAKDGGIQVAPIYWHGMSHADALRRFKSLVRL